MSFDLSAAVSRNRFWASTRRRVKHGPKRLVWQGQGWGPLYGAIAAWVFGEYDPAPTPARFAQLVARWQNEQGGLAVNGVLNRTAWRKMHGRAAQGLPEQFASPVNGLPRPQGWSQVIATFGDPRSMPQARWEESHIGAARAPVQKGFALPDGRRVGALPLHHALVPHAEAFFAAVARGGLWDELQPVGRAYEWDPEGNSLHTWGIALDLRPRQYVPAHRPRDYPDQKHYPPGYLVRHIQAFGWQWGLWFEVAHPGHLQFATGVEAC